MIQHCGMFGGYEIVLIIVAVLLLFGGKKIPELARGLGKGVKEFKDATEDVNLKEDLKAKAETINGISFIAQKVGLEPNSIRDLAFKLNKEMENLFLVLGAVNNGKVTLTVMLSENLVKEKGLNAGTIIRDLAREIGGGGGGQPHFATAGGKNPRGLDKAFAKAKEMI